jgi:hypothetical protein
MQKAKVRVGDEYTEECEIGRGVRQGCCLSPLLFNLYTEEMMKEALEDVDEGVKVGGKIIKETRFADDQALVSGTQEGLQRLVDGLCNTAKEYDMKLNVKKTKVMRVARKGGDQVQIMIEGQQVEQVKKFKYLGSLITDDGKCRSEIIARIAMAKEAFNNRKELLTRKISKKVKKKIVKTIVWSVALYGAETWTMGIEEKKRVEALEMWIWRKMEGVMWSDKISNEKVLEAVGEKRTMLQVILDRQKRWIGHNIRRGGLLKEVIEGKIEGKKGQGRPRRGMLDDLKKGSYRTMKRRAENREEWRCWVPWTCQTADY